MKLSRPFFPKIPSHANEFALKMVQRLFDRDEEIRTVVNRNAPVSASRPNLTVAESNGTTEVTLVASPPVGTSRLVELVTAYYFTISGVTHPLTLFLDDGSTHYNLEYESAFAWTESIFTPNSVQNRSLVLENGVSLKAVTDATGADKMHFTASWRDDVPVGEDTSSYHLSLAETPAPPDSIDPVILVDTPEQHRVHRVHNVTFSNDDAVPHHFSLSLYDIANTDRYYLSLLGTVAANTVGIYLGGGQVIYVPHGFRLEGECLIAEDTSPSHWTAHYRELHEDDHIAG
jgi:hypothetical protein